MEKKTMMAPSGRSDAAAAAFTSLPIVNVPSPREHERSKTILQSSASSVTESYDDESNNNTNCSMFATRGGHQSYESKNEIQTKQRVSRPDEPNLYDIPADIYPTYRPLPILVRVLISLSSVAISWKEFITLQFTSHHRLVSATVKNAMAILVRYLVVSTVAKFCLQEVMSPPSRVSTSYLADNGLLPSTLSRYQSVTPIALHKVMSDDNMSAVEVNEKTAINSLGVHSICYTNPTYNHSSNGIEEVSRKRKSQQKQAQPSKKLIDAVYLHHGFGASSLSWLPVLPSLTKQMGARVGMAHDSVGFGFTDRPHSLESYSPETNVGIGLELLNESDGNARNIAIFGHSMGAKAALIMALACSKRKDAQLNPSVVVLVAPALEGVALPSSSRRKSSPKTTKSSNKISQLLRPIWIAWKKLIVDYPFQYGLRRLVGGSPNFWRKGLTSAWGDPKCLSDSDVLRFQWPSIGRGWEQGLLNFVRSKLSSSSSSSSSLPLEDGELLRQVCNLPNTKVVIIYGSKDPIVRLEGSVAEKVKKEFPSICMIRMEGLGHDPFEEDVDAFLNELKAVL